MIESLLEQAPPHGAVMYLINALSFDGEWENIPMSDLLVYLDVKVVMDLIENKKDNVVYATIPKFSYGNKEYDLAWAILLRPGQQFLKTIDEREKFLDSYSKYCTFDRNAFDYYTVLFGSYFYQISPGDEFREYRSIIKHLIYQII